jgi:xylan 1,4-beta-xylosidase
VPDRVEVLRWHEGGPARLHLGDFADNPNYLTTAPSIGGPWSDPVLLHARGFDASLFHDGDEGDPVLIDLPPGEGWIEGPNLYRIGG